MLCGHFECNAMKEHAFPYHLRHVRWQISESDTAPHQGAFRRHCLSGHKIAAMLAVAQTEYKLHFCSLSISCYCVELRENPVKDTKKQN